MFIAFLSLQLDNFQFFSLKISSRYYIQCNDFSNQNFFIQVKHGKQYENEEEEANRFTIFKENLNKITEHNKKFETGEVSWSQGLNQFADLTQEEFAKSYLGGIRPRTEGLTGLN